MCRWELASRFWRVANRSDQYKQKSCMASCLLYFLSCLSFWMPFSLPWVPEFFLASGENFRCWLKADTSLVIGRSHERWSREKTSGTERCFLPSPLTSELFYRITFTPIRLKVSDCDHVGRHVKKCPKTHIILRKTSSSLKFIALRAIMTGSNRSSP